MKKLLFVLFALLVSMQFAFAATNINTATEAELDKLPGIGPVKAKAIVEDRQKNGNFKSIEDIKRVKGIGDATFNALKSELTVSGATTAPVATAKPAATKPATAKAEAKAEAKPEVKTAPAAAPAAAAAPCEAKAAEKKLAGAAKTTFMKKCEKDEAGTKAKPEAAKPEVKAAPAAAAAPSCEAKATEKKLAGAAKTTFMKKCEKDAADATAKPAAKK